VTTAGCPLLKMDCVSWGWGLCKY